MPRPSVTVSDEFARPTDTAPYAAKDVVTISTSAPRILTFANAMVSSDGAGWITKARIITDQSTNTARFRLWLFHTAPTAINDNALFTRLWANRAKEIGYIDFPAMSTEGSGSDAAGAMNDGVRMRIKAAGRDLYGIPVTLDIFTPASAQNFRVELQVDQD
jgi:hypothetical protein